MNRQINVLHIITGDQQFWGVERYVLNLSIEVAKLGVTSKVLCLHQAIADRFVEHGVAASTAQLRGYLDITAVKNLRSFIGANDIHIVHSHMGLDSLLAAAAVAGSSVRHVSSVHFLEPTWAKAPWLKRSIWRLVQQLKNTQIDRFLPITPQVSANLQKREGVPERKITVVYPGIPTPPEQLARNEARKAIGANEDELIIAMIARLTPEKNVASAIRTCAELQKVLPNFRLIVAGEGSERRYLQNLIVDRGLTERVQLIGYQDDVRPLLAGADLFLSTSSAEGFGIAAVEAMFAALPVVGWSGLGIDFIVEQSKSGVLLEAGNELSLAAQLKTLASDQALRRSMGQAARARAETVFTAKRMSEEIFSVYESETTHGD